jgi:hypothetical protein
VLEAIYAEDVEPHLTELAYHFAEASPAGDASIAVGYARRAGERRGRPRSTKRPLDPARPAASDSAVPATRSGAISSWVGERRCSRETADAQRTSVRRRRSRRRFCRRTAWLGQRSYGGTRSRGARAGDSYLVRLLQDALLRSAKRTAGSVHGAREVGRRLRDQPHGSLGHRSVGRPSRWRATFQIGRRSPTRSRPGSNRSGGRRTPLSV